MTERTPNRWLRFPGRAHGDAYDSVYDDLAASGHDVHGEATFVQSLGVRSVLDAGCGTGRVARELARRGLDVVGVDLDPDMLATARRKAPRLDWRLADLETIDLGRSFDAVLLAGNVMVFLTPGTEGAVLANLARHLPPGGLLVAGFQIDRHLELAEYDRLTAAAGLTLAERWATWDCEPFRPSGDYAVSVHRKPPA